MIIMGMFFVSELGEMCFFFVGYEVVNFVVDDGYVVFVG